MAKNYALDVMNACVAYPEASIFVTDGYWVEETDKYSELDITLLNPFYEQKPDLCKETLFQRLYWHNCIFAPGVSLRREVYDKYGLYDVDICIEDLEYWLRISRSKETEFVYIDKKDVFYRKNPNSVSSKEKNAQYIERRLVFMEASEKIIDKYGKYVETEEYVRRKWESLLEELQFYRENIPKEKIRILRKKLRPFIKTNWGILGWKQLAMYYHIYIIFILEKMNFK